MKIVQVVEGFKKGDGIGNVVMSFMEFMNSTNIQNEILPRRLTDKDVDLFNREKDCVIFYHYWLHFDTKMIDILLPKVLVYHNITEPDLLRGIDEETRVLCSAGKNDLRGLHKCFDFAIALSEYSKHDLVEAGWDHSKVFVLPIIVRLEKFNAEPDQEVISHYSDDKKNIIFTGRIFPHKRHEDIIAAFYEYKKVFNNNSRLIIVGAPANKRYFESLKAYVKKLEINDDVVFTGFVSMRQYIAFYKIADLFLCMSAHEGFCIPLVEAMYMKVPIIALATTAVPETLGCGGVLIHDNNPDSTAKLIDKIFTDEIFNRTIVDSQNKRLAELSRDKLEKKYLDFIGLIINEIEKMKDSIQNRFNVSKVSSAFKYLPSKIININEDKEKIEECNGEVIIYGAGVAGASVTSQLIEELSLDRIWVCDTFKAGMIDIVTKKAIISRDELIENHKGASIIITVNNRLTAKEIVCGLADDGVELKDIFFYEPVGNYIW